MDKSAKKIAAFDGEFLHFLLGNRKHGEIVSTRIVAASAGENKNIYRWVLLCFFELLNDGLVHLA
jgi:hypothetical protein